MGDIKKKGRKMEAIKIMKRKFGKREKIEVRNKRSDQTNLGNKRE
jgi:hypothetical protein